MIWFYIKKEKIKIIGRDMYKVCYLIIVILSLFSNAAFSDAVYIKRPLFHGNLFVISPNNPIFYFPVERLEEIKEGKIIEMPTEKLQAYFNTLEIFSTSILEKITNKELPNVVHQGQIKSSKDEIYTFYLNNCFAFIANFEKEIFLIHGFPINNSQAFSKDLINVKKLISREGCSYYLITNEKDRFLDLLGILDKNIKLLIYEQMPNTVSSIKVVKRKNDLDIYMESHINTGVNFSNFEKLQAHMPWGPLEKVSFSKINNNKK